MRRRKIATRSFGSRPRLQRRLAQVCAKHGVTLCYLFGSQVEGSADTQSDVDLGVVFEKPPSKRRSLPMWEKLQADIEPIFAPRRVDLIFLQCVPSHLQNDAVHGKLIFKASGDARANFEDDVMRRWLDFKPFYEASLRDEAEAIRDGHFFVER